MIKETIILTVWLSLSFSNTLQAQPPIHNEKEFPLARYVDPRIGSEGLGRFFISPACPFGMVK